MKHVFYFLFLVLCLSSCLKEEEPIKAFDRGGAIVKTISTGSNGNYANQVFFDFASNKEVKVVDRTTWDLAFESSASGTVVRTNTANKITVSKTGLTDFSGITSLTSMTLKFDWDRAEGSADSMALKDWISAGVPTNEVFVIDLGETPSLSARGYKKLQILSATATNFKIKYANIDGSNEQTLLIPKEPAKNHTCFSFAGNGSVVDIEPNKQDWDIVFTQYLHTFNDSDPPVSYSVNGVLLSPNSVKAAKVFDKSFSDITLDDVSNYTLTDDLSVIGYDWKLFDFTSRLYEVDPLKNYLIQDRNGNYYKLRFIDFYNDLGIKGYPKFEFVKL